MGYGTWTAQSFASYSTSRGYDFDRTSGSIVGEYSAQDMFKSRRIDPMLDPKNVRRECRDSDEHPNSKPVILGLDVTGSMGDGAVKVAKSLNNIMENLYKSVEDVEFMVMGIGDLYCDDAPIQASQFESDIRIAEQLDKIYFEGGGGGNGYESYTAAWYFGLYNCELDCWKRGKKGTIITIGDEPLNPYLQKSELKRVLGNIGHDTLTETEELYKAIIEKYNVYHIALDDRSTSYRWYEGTIENSWKPLLGDHLYVSTLNELPKTIAEIVKKSNSDDTVVDTFVDIWDNNTVEDAPIDSDGIGW